MFVNKAGLYLLWGAPIGECRRIGNVVAQDTFSDVPMVRKRCDGRLSGQLEGLMGTSTKSARSAKNIIQVFAIASMVPWVSVSIRKTERPRCEECTARTRQTVDFPLPLF